MYVGFFGSDTASWAALQETFHDEEGLVDFFNGTCFFAHGGSDGGDADRPAFEFVDDGIQDAVVHIIEAMFVDIEGGEAVFGDFNTYGTIAFDLGEIPNTPEQCVGDAWRSAASAGYFVGAFVADLNFQNPS